MYSETLSDIMSQIASGTWKLEFRNRELGNIGTLNSWFVEICSQTAIPSGVYLVNVQDGKKKEVKKSIVN